MKEKKHVIVFGLISTVLTIFFTLFSYIFEIGIVMVPSIIFAIVTCIILSELRNKPDLGA